MKRLKNIHPGKILKEEFLVPMRIAVYRLSKETGLTQTRLGQIIRGERDITAETALKLGKFFGVPAAFWMNLQNLFDLEEAERAHEKEIKKIHTAEELGLISA
jgi:addiction module HigA family antidote